MPNEALLLTLVFILAGTTVACLVSLKLKVIPLYRSALHKRKKPSKPLILLIATLSSLALISGCTTGALIGTFLSVQPAKAITARLDEKFLITFFALFAIAILVFFAITKLASRDRIASERNKIITGSLMKSTEQPVSFLRESVKHFDYFFHRLFSHTKTRI